MRLNKRRESLRMADDRGSPLRLAAFEHVGRGEGDTRQWSPLPNRAFPYGDFWHAFTRADP